MSRIRSIILVAIWLFNASRAIADQTAAEFISSLGPLQTDFYSEVYSSPLNKVSNQFQRLRLGLAGESSWSPYLGVENFSSDGIRNFAGEVGLRNTFEDFQIIGGLRREKLNDSAFSYWNLRIGLIFSRFWQLEGPFFADAYAEVFANQQEAQKSGASLSGWGKYGYRFYQKDHLFFDPFIVGARFYDNSDRRIFGSDYQLLQIGVQGGIYFEKPDFSSTVILTKSWGRSQSAPVVNDYWLLWALGVRF